MAVTGLDLREDPMEMFYEGRERFFADTEKKFNVAGYIPLFSLLTGPGRILIGKTLLVVDVVAAIFYTLGSMFAAHSNKVYERRAAQHIIYAVHDMVNMIRGVVEFIPFLGNGIMIVYDSTCNRFRYPIEKASS